MTYALIYLAIGAANYAVFAARGNSILFSSGKRRDGSPAKAGLAEATFFVLAWPVQLLFAAVVGINVLTSAALEKAFR